MSDDITVQEITAIIPELLSPEARVGTCSLVGSEQTPGRSSDLLREVVYAMNECRPPWNLKLKFSLLVPSAGFKYPVANPSRVNVQLPTYLPGPPADHFQLVHSGPENKGLRAYKWVRGRKCHHKKLGIAYHRLVE